jgi:hypothetical protein
MISLRLGNLGSGKSLMAVRELALNETHRTTYTNIRTNLKNCILLTPDMIVKKEVIGTKRTGEEVCDYKPNLDYWQSIPKPINIYLDEMQNLYRNRNFASKINRCISEWLSMLRRILGSSEAGYGQLVSISQTQNIDKDIRDLATNIQYHIAHFKKTCKRCGTTWKETSDHPEPMFLCPVCRDYRLKKHSVAIEIYHFADMNSFEMWKNMGMRTYHKHRIVHDTEKYMQLYSTEDWKGFFTGFV